MNIPPSEVRASVDKKPVQSRDTGIGKIDGFLEITTRRV
jgi:hypothetical protein